MVLSTANVADSPRHRRTPDRASSRDQALVASTVALGVGLAVNSLLGPSAFEVIDYRYGTSMINASSSTARGQQGSGPPRSRNPGTGGFEGLLLGSVNERVAQKTTRPVAVIRAAAPVRTGRGGGASMDPPDRSVRCAGPQQKPGFERPTSKWSTRGSYRLLRLRR
jgi:hypothetical protein